MWEVDCWLLGADVFSFPLCNLFERKKCVDEITLEQVIICKAGNCSTEKPNFYMLEPASKMKSLDAEVYKELTGNLQALFVEI